MVLLKYVLVKTQIIFNLFLKKFPIKFLTSYTLLAVPSNTLSTGLSFFLCRVNELSQHFSNTGLVLLYDFIIIIVLSKLFSETTLLHDYAFAIVKSLIL